MNFNFEYFTQKSNIPDEVVNLCMIGSTELNIDTWDAVGKILRESPDYLRHEFGDDVFFTEIKEWKKWFTKRSSTLIVAFDGTTPAGYAIVGKSSLVIDEVCRLFPNDLNKSYKGLSIHELYVDKSYRNHGVASALLTEIKKYAKNNRAKVVTLSVREDNIPAKGCYNKNGYSTCGYDYAYAVKGFSRGSAVELRMSNSVSDDTEVEIYTKLESAIDDKIKHLTCPNHSTITSKEIIEFYRSHNWSIFISDDRYTCGTIGIAGNKKFAAINSLYIDRVEGHRHLPELRKDFKDLFSTLCKTFNFEHLFMRNEDLDLRPILESCGFKAYYELMYMEL